jgi:hypothetical protein
MSERRIAAMIQKDIVHGAQSETNNFQPTPANSEPSVDDIFAAADKKIDQQNRSMLATTKTKNKRRHAILRFVLSSVIILIIIIGAIVGIVSYKLKQAYPSMKSNLLSQIESIQTELRETDDSTLTVDQYYQKRLLLLFSVDEIDAAINNLWDMNNFINVLENPDVDDDSFIPQNKLQEYEQLVEEYHKAKQAEAESQVVTNTTETSTSIQEIE